MTNSKWSCFSSTLILHILRHLREFYKAKNFELQQKRRTKLILPESWQEEPSATTQQSSLLRTKVSAGHADPTKSNIKVFTMARRLLSQFTPMLSLFVSANVLPLYARSLPHWPALATSKGTYIDEYAYSIFGVYLFTFPIPIYLFCPQLSAGIKMYSCPSILEQARLWMSYYIVCSR